MKKGTAENIDGALTQSSIQTQSVKSPPKTHTSSGFVLPSPECCLHVNLPWSSFAAAKRQHPRAKGNPSVELSRLRFAVLFLSRFLWDEVFLHALSTGGWEWDRFRFGGTGGCLPKIGDEDVSQGWIGAGRGGHVNGNELRREGGAGSTKARIASSFLPLRRQGKSTGTFSL